MTSGLLVATLSVAYAAADRFSGGGLGWEKLKHDGGGFLRGRPIYYAIPLLAGVTYLADPHNTWLWLGLLAWALWRLPGWKLFGGRMDPKTTSELAGTYVRHSVVFLALVATLAVNGKMSILDGTGIAIVYPMVATGLGVYLRWFKDHDGHDVNWVVEVARGTVFGTILALTAIHVNIA